MKSDMILQAELLDITFHNRNKDYGAYDLRSQYNRRLLKAVAITFSIVLLFSLSWYVQAKFFKGAKSLVAGETGPDIHLQKAEIKPKIKSIESKSTSTKNNVKQNANPVFRIVPDELADKPIPENKSLESSEIGLVTTTGDNDSGFVHHVGMAGGDTITIAEGPGPIAEERTGPYDLVQIMPEFPGESEAFLKFMLRNLKEADDLEEGEKAVVRVRFVVEADGYIDHVEIVNAATRYDAEVIGVIEKMPRWKPGVQDGISVPVYFTLPVTFQGKE